MAGESLIIGDGNWGVKSSSLLGYAMNSDRFVPRELTFTRATTGTRTNGALLVENTPPNLFTYSEEFNNALWGKASSITIRPNTTIAPNGTMTADSLVLTSAGSCFIFQSPTISTVAFTTSIYVKYVDRQFIQILFSGGVNDFANFDLINKTVVGGTYVSASVTSEGDNWLRISITGTGIPFTPFDTYIWAVDSGSAARASACNGIGSYSIWGAQIVNGPSPLSYFPTTTRLNIPRVDYSTGTAALLLEPQRTNIVLRSEEFDSASWQKSGATIIANDTTAPSGLTTADRITQSAATVNISQVVSLSAGAVTFSTYVKRGNFDSSTTFLFGLFSTVTADIGYISFNFVTGTTTVYSGTFISHSATNVGNGWYRIQGTINVPSTGLGYFYNGGAGLTIAGVGSYYYSWGAQVEVGNYATSYIPTTSASVTRNADTMTRSNIYTNNLITSAGGTWIVNLKNNIPITRDGVESGIYIDSLSGGFTNGINIRNAAAASRVSISKWIAGAGTPLYTTTTDNVKIAIKWNGTTADIFENGVKVVSATSFAITNMEFLQAFGNASARKFISSIMLYPTPLSDAECINITK